MNNTGTIPEREYRRLNPDGHWFDTDTLRFFRSRIGAHAYGADGKALYFISSEKSPWNARGYAVRRLDLTNGDIDGDVDEFATYSQARTALKNRAASNWKRADVA